ncbi:sensor histidine kinase KdpD [Acidovorax sp.]|uniref:sensor histidine kinase n=1 Tax=Acidovorax sp. TaxID=1872122 RepID=UPI0025C46996|nr:sensor histidine kinase KdpD [Acidovorax sp.]MBL7088868.1 sensor histidine kinase KdpD [Acidovorax sp.]
MQDRPDPDALLQRIQQEQAQQQRGRLKVFFGACAGVGKTFAMLSAARAAQAQGLPVTIGVVETHGRTDTEALTAHLPRLPLRALPYKDRTLPEFDLDAALAWGAANPEGLVLLDELAHSNVAGSRHPKRWQDAEELLAAGIDVWSTMNVQHLESLNDIVSGITGIRVWETVPDQFFDAADEVVVVDLPPDELLARLKAGKVYLPQQAERAAANFFRKGNLLALRELALRRTADRVDDEMRAYRRASTTTAEAVWPNREALLACVGTGDNTEKVVRSCARLAAQLDLPWHAVHVETPEQQGQSANLHPQVERTLKIAQQLGATACAVLPAAQRAPALVRYAREHNLVRVVMGRSARRWPWQATLAEQIGQSASDLDLLQVGTPAGRRGSTNSTRAAPRIPPATTRPPFWPGYIAAALACCIAAVIATPLANVLELTNIVMLFLLVVVGVALRFGRGPAIMAAFLGVGFFDFFFVPPRFNFAVSDAQYVVTFAVMLVVALVVGQLTAGLKVQAEAATDREHRVRSLYDMARDLSAALLPEQVAEIGGRFITGEFSAGSTLVVADDDNRLQVLPGGTAPVDMAVAQWAFERGEPAGRGTDTLHSSPTLVLPLKAPMRIRGVLVVAMPHDQVPGVEPRRLLQTCASLLAISLERIHYIDVAQKSTVQIESERLRNSLLSAISHDLRTPLASLVGLAESLAMVHPPLPAHQQELTGAIQQSAQRMSALVNNLLDMARLEAGAVQLNKAWQLLEEVVGSALAASAPAIAAHRIEVNLPGDLPLLQIDAVLMERVLVNLLENAAKYTPASTAIRISAQAQSDAVALSITDEGPGLPKGREELLFEKFERGARESATPGVGLGLAICRAIVQAHGGSIWGDTILNAQGQPAGARFTLLLPRGTPPTDLGDDADA